MTEGQGLLPIGSRLLVDASDVTPKERLVRQAQSAKANAQVAIETQSDDTKTASARPPLSQAI